MATAARQAKAHGTMQRAVSLRQQFVNGSRSLIDKYSYLAASLV
jgi:hypothetical protein